MELYIGSASDYSLNPVCPGGPYMKVGEHASSYKDYVLNGSSKEFIWNYGAEVWCNKPGQYVTIVADLTTLVGSYEMSVCNLGLFGTKYERA